MAHPQNGMQRQRGEERKMQTEAAALWIALALVLVLCSLALERLFRRVSAFSYVTNQRALVTAACVVFNSSLAGITILLSAKKGLHG